MKLIVAIVKDEHANRVIDALTASEYQSTRIQTAGGFLKRGNATILVGVDDHRVDDALAVIRSHADTATIFVLNVLRHVRL